MIPESDYTGGLFDGHFGPMQTELTGMFDAEPPETPSLREVLLYRFARHFRVRYEELGLPDSVPEELADIPFMCVMLAAGGHIRSAEPIVQALLSCREELVAVGLYAHLEQLPFNLCLECLGKTDHIVRRIERMLTAPGSGYRIHAFELSWFVRDRLNPLIAVPALLKNTEDTLGYWLESLSLCRHLFADAEEFWQAAMDYTPSVMPDQYQERIAAVREKTYLVEYPLHFHNLELRCRRAVEAVSLSMRSLPSNYFSLADDADTRS